MGVKPEEEAGYEPVGLKIDETENLDVVHLCRETQVQNIEGDLENSSKIDGGKSFIETVIDRIKTLSKDDKTEVGDNEKDVQRKAEEEEKNYLKEEKKRKKKELEQEEKLLKIKKA